MFVRFVGSFWSVSQSCGWTSMIHRRKILGWFEKGLFGRKLWWSIVILIIEWFLRSISLACICACFCFEGSKLICELSFACSDTHEEMTMGRRLSKTEFQRALDRHIHVHLFIFCSLLFSLFSFWSCYLIKFTIRLYVFQTRMQRLFLPYSWLC